MPIHNGKVLNLLKIVVSGSILCFLIFKIDWSEALRTVSDAYLPIIFGAFFLSFFERMVVTYKWAILLRVRGMKIRFVRLLRIVMTGSFFGLVLPSSLSTDAVRGYMLYRSSDDKALSASSVIVDRLLGMISLFALAGISLLVCKKTRLTMQLFVFVILVFIILLCCYWLVKNEKVFSKFIRLFDFKLTQSLKGKVVKFWKSLVEYIQFPKALILCFSLSLGVQFIRVLIYYFISRGYGLDIGIIYFLIYIPIIIMVIMIPISVGGIGLREATFIIFFTGLGLSNSEAVIVAFTSSLVTNLISLSGGMFYLLHRSVPIES